ncbi:globin family protein [Bradyrhizobium sp. S69]|uniref:globin family protein n=1 Tax=Bradyrhizobium sp. S69 TaxID=1641856 RepID=UPI00131C9E5F|nr:globin family protein [Bradyrhizobium sp. S69]
MTPADIDLVKESYAWVKPISEVAAELFYQRLFLIAPEVKPLFKGDMKEQGRKLMMTTGSVVNALDRLETILPTVKELAVRHVGYGVRDEHYDKVGSALLWTLETGLGAPFTKSHSAAWGEAYAALSGVMRKAA